MKNSLLNRFVPKESKFFPLLNQLSKPYSMLLNF